MKDAYKVAARVFFKIMPGSERNGEDREIESKKESS